MEDGSASGRLSSVYVETGVSGPAPRGSDTRGHGRTAGKSPCCCTMGERPGRPLEAVMCTGVCAGGRWGQRAKSGVGFCWKTRLVNMRHTEESSMCPALVFTPFALPGAGFG